jgi:hypothetical protein
MVRVVAVGGETVSAMESKGARMQLGCAKNMS